MHGNASTEAQVSIKVLLQDLKCEVCKLTLFSSHKAIKTNSILIIQEVLLTRTRTHTQTLIHVHRTHTLSKIYISLSAKTRSHSQFLNLTSYSVINFHSHIFMDMYLYAVSLTHILNSLSLSPVGNLTLVMILLLP